MKVLLAFYGDETQREGRTREDYQRVIGAWQAFEDAAREAGVLVACEALESTPATTTVRIEGGRRRIVDGPYMETKEQLGGFALLEVARPRRGDGLGGADAVEPRRLHDRDPPGHGLRGDVAAS